MKAPEQAPGFTDQTHFDDSRTFFGILQGIEGKSKSIDDRREELEIELGRREEEAEQSLTLPDEAKEQARMASDDRLAEKIEKGARARMKNRLYSSDRLLGMLSLEIEVLEKKIAHRDQAISNQDQARTSAIEVHNTLNRLRTQLEYGQRHGEDIPGFEDVNDSIRTRINELTPILANLSNQAGE